MKRMSFLFLILALVAGVLGSGCNYSVPSEVQTPGLGGATVGKYVAIGNSLTSGYQSNALYESAQIYSYPNLIAQQLTKAGATIGAFQQPIYSDPGNADPLTGKAARYELLSLTGPVIAPRGIAAGVPTNSTLARPYDNLGIPGAIIYDFLDTTNVNTKAAARKNPFFQLVQRSPAFGKSVFLQVLNLRPISILTFWLGNNDVLGFATSGGVSPSAPTPKGDATTPVIGGVPTFWYWYHASLKALRDSLPTTNIVVANIPDVKAIPFFTTMGPKLAAGIAAAKAANPAIQGLFYQKHGEIAPATGLTMLDASDANPPLITLKGSTYATYLGAGLGQTNVEGGKWYRDLAASLGIPVATLLAANPGIDTTKPFGFHPQNPWPDALTLDASEQATAAQAISDFNGIVATEAATYNCAVVDVYSIFNSIKANGYASAGLLLKTDYITGGIFSLDGVHPSSMGAGVVANEFIRVINAQSGMHVPMVNLANLPGIPIAFTLSKTLASGNVIPVIPLSAFKSFEMLFPAVTTY